MTDPVAERYAPFLEGLPVSIVTPDGFGLAYFAMAEGRRVGREFAALILLGDRRAEFTYHFAPRIVREQPSYDWQRMYFDSAANGTLELSGETIVQRSAMQPGFAEVISDMLHLPDVIVVRSWAEWARLRELLKYSRGNVARWYPQRRLPNYTPAKRRDLVVVWAAEYAAELAAMHTFALHNLHEEIVVVSRGGVGTSTRCRYVGIDSPELPAILARAACIVDTTIDDPSWVQAFAARGASVAAPSTSGALEVADGIALYVPWAHEGIWGATVEAIGRPASRVRETPPPPQTIAHALEGARPQMPSAAPLVSIVIPTYNRRDDLVRVLGSVKAQTYRNVEVIVVNDGGSSLAGVDDDPRIRVIELEHNVGMIRAVNHGVREARGTYVQILADDDELYPDHLIRLVDALERTGAGVAHSNVLIRYESPGSDGTFETTGYNASIFCAPLDRVMVYSSSPVAGQALLVRRELFDRIGLWDEDCVLFDQEMQIRLSEVSEFVHVPNVTAEWLVREGGDQYFRKKQKDVIGDMRRIFERHPAPGREYIEAQREVTLKAVAGRPPGYVFPPVISTRPPPR